MNENFQKTFEEQLAYLPEVNQRALRSFDWATELIAIGKQHGLHIDELEDLQIETMLVLVGLVHPNDYESELINRLAISPAEAGKIIADINTHVFIPIHDYIINETTPKNVPLTPDPAPVNDLERVGISITQDDQPVPTPQTPLARVGGSVLNQKISSSSGTPLQFQPGAPMITPVQSPKPHLSMQKLQQLHQQRQKIIDTTIQSM